MPQQAAWLFLESTGAQAKSGHIGYLQTSKHFGTVDGLLTSIATDLTIFK
jgi:hypothetical protein